MRPGQDEPGARLAAPPHVGVLTTGHPASRAGLPARQAVHFLPTDPICMEIPVRIRGSQLTVLVPGITERTEPFHEETYTLIVFPQGAVVRLSASVAPGQVLVLTNPRTNQDAPCRVVKVRTSSSLKDYVEIVFTERATGFWGVSFPSEASNSSHGPVTPATINDPRGKEQPIKSTSSVRAAAHMSNMSVAAPFSLDGFRGASGKYERRTILLYDHSSPLKISGATLDQQSTPKQTGRGLQPRGILILATLSISFLILVLVPGRILLRRQLEGTDGAHVGSSHVTIEVAAPSEGGPHLETTPDSGTSQMQLHPSANSDGQLSAQVQPSTPSSAGLQEENKEPTYNVSRGLPMTGKLTAGAVTPEKVDVLEEDPNPPNLVGEIPGGVSGGEVGRVLGVIISEVSRTGLRPALPPTLEVHSSIRVGGHVKAPRLLFSVLPVYPTVAKRDRVEGDVTVQAHIDTAGNVIRMKVVSGPPPLHQAAMDALRRWKYEPSRLDDQPVLIELLATMRFRLK